jgi:hypothetical protein
MLVQNEVSGVYHADNGMLNLLTASLVLQATQELPDAFVTIEQHKKAYCSQDKTQKVQKIKYTIFLCASSLTHT